MTKRIIPIKRSFASHPKSKFWSDENTLKPRDVSMNCNKKFFFKCDQCKHIFDVRLNDITMKNSWCSFCASKKLCDDNKCKQCFDKSFASDPHSKYWGKDNTLKPREVFKNCNKRFFFKCDKCKHIFDSKLSDVSKRNVWCSYCVNKRLCDNEQCTCCFEKSFASHPKNKFWSDENTLKPREVFKNSHTKYIFECDKCDHSFNIALNELCYKNSWCTYCSNNQLCDDDKCELCYEKSFASHPKSKFWSDNNDKDPRKVFKGSNKKFNFNCKVCLHTFSKSLASVSQNGWCPYCASRRLCNDEECDKCFNKSFASHPKSIFFSKKNKVYPRDIFKCTASNYYFDCDNCKLDFSSSPHVISQGKWCPHCRNKTEKMLYDNLLKTYPTIEREFRPKWCINKETNRILPFDFIIPEYNIIIELDGAQHFRQVHIWKSPEFTQERDLYKMKRANKNGFSVIRVVQEEVYRNKHYDYGKLIDKIEEVAEEDKADNYFICDNNEYDVYDR